MEHRSHGRALGSCRRELDSVRTRVELGLARVFLLDREPMSADGVPGCRPAAVSGQRRVLTTVVLSRTG
jgi:hypothetical protein